MSLAVAALLFTALTLTVQADTSVARPASTLPPASPAEAITPPVAAQHKPAAPLRVLHGIASWYGGAFDGHLTASGERYDMDAMTAAELTLPFGSMVRVVDLKNHRSVVVRINDRGTLPSGRVIDLSHGAAEQLHIVQPGTAPVKVDVLSLGHRRYESAEAPAQ
ncbi:MAG: septal ring lytic transglycosylase RlpA family protein [Terracidiphilus sp.]